MSIMMTIMFLHTTCQRMMMLFTPTQSQHSLQHFKHALEHFSPPILTCLCILKHSTPKERPLCIYCFVGFVFFFSNGIPLKVRTSRFRIPRSRYPGIESQTDTQHSLKQHGLSCLSSSCCSRESTDLICSMSCTLTDQKSKLKKPFHLTA